MPGFGTDWGSFSQLAELDHITRLEATRAYLRDKKKEERKVGNHAAKKPEDVLKQAISDCISEMWPDYALVSFKVTRKPTPGTSGDEFNGETQIKDIHNNVTATIVSDPTPDAGPQAAMDHFGLGGATPVGKPFNPWWGYVRWGRETYGSAASEYVYPALYGTNTCRHRSMS